MGNRDRWDRKKRSEENAGKPLGGGLDESALKPLAGKASVGELSIAKPVELDGKKGLRVEFRLHCEGLGKARLVVETTLHEQIRGPLKSSVTTLADSQGNLCSFELFTPADDEPTSSKRRAFFPFAAIEVDGAGKHRCFARVRILEEERGSLCEDEVAFELDAG
jgi:hypothetical protein